jgi:hypothetical protein
MGILLGAAGTLRAAEVEVHVDQSRIGLNDSVRLTVISKKGEGEVDVSPIKDFKVLPRGASTHIQVINFKQLKETRYNYILIPKKKGTLKIPSLEVRFPGEKIRTREMIIHVTDKARPDSEKKEIFVKAEVSDNNPYVGQQIIYSFKFYGWVKITNMNIEPPSFSGFEAAFAGKQKPYKTQMSGRPVLVREARFNLVPRKDGKLIIDPTVFQCDIVRRSRRQSKSRFDSFFNDSFFGMTRLEPKVYRTDAVHVEVKPLPVYTGTEKFSGLIGRFTMTAELDRNKVVVGDSATLSIVIAGTGNVQDIHSPEIGVPDGFKVYSDNPVEKISLGTDGWRGEKIFKHALVPVKPGDYSLDPPPLCYFDIKQGAYTTITIPPFALHVAPSLEKDELKVFSGKKDDSRPGREKEKVEFTGRDILPIKDQLDAIKHHEMFSVYRFGIYVLLPILAFIIVRILVSRFRREHPPEIIMSQRAQEAMKAARKTDASDEEFFSCLYKALVSAVFAKAGTLGESLTYREIIDILEEQGFSGKVSREAADRLESIESAKYSGSKTGTERRQKLLAEVQALIKELLK